MSAFFINRPIFAWVLALLVMLAGLLALLNLPVAQFPPLAPPAIAITVSYPGASAETVQNTVVQPIEQQMGGLDNLIYMSSESLYRAYPRRCSSKGCALRRQPRTFSWPSPSSPRTTACVARISPTSSPPTYRTR